MRCRSNRNRSQTAAMVIGLLMSASLFADEAWLERSREILESSRQQPMPEWLKDAMQPKANKRGFRPPESKDLGLLSSPSHEPQGPMTYLFVSQSLGIETLREIVGDNRGRKDRVIVFRGLPEGQSLKEFVAGFRSLIEGMERKEIPPMSIDPERFTQYGITQVPAIVHDDGKGHYQSVRGVQQVDWLDRQNSQSPRSHNYGQRGETVAISEPDLLERVKARARNFDWATYRREAQTHFWKEVRFESLPQASSDREFWVDPSFTVPRDLKDTKGQLIAIKDQQVNPLKTLPFHQKLIVFNGTRPAEVDRVSQEIRSASTPQLTLMATEIERISGWDGLKNLQKKLGMRVFLLTPDLRKRFKLAATPSVIEAVENQFRIREIGMRKGG